MSLKKPPSAFKQLLDVCCKQSSLQDIRQGSFCHRFPLRSKRRPYNCNQNKVLACAQMAISTSVKNVQSVYILCRCDRRWQLATYRPTLKCILSQKVSVLIGVDLSKILGGARSGQSAMTDDLVGVSGAT